MNYYFTYGSNMDYKQMMKRCPDSKYFGVGFLQDYKLAFTRYSPKWDSAVADILVSPGDVVWGLIYILNNDDLEKLDRHEGHPTIYKRITETVLKYAPFLIESAIAKLGIISSGPKVKKFPSPFLAVKTDF